MRSPSMTLECSTERKPLLRVVVQEARTAVSWVSVSPSPFDTALEAEELARVLRQLAHPLVRTAATRAHKLSISIALFPTPWITVPVHPDRNRSFSRTSSASGRTAWRAPGRGTGAPEEGLRYPP